MLLSEAGELSVSDVADVLVVGGGLPAARSLLVPREITLTLRQRPRGVSLSGLRAALLPYCRPEAGAVVVQYVGAQRSLQLLCEYLGGLDALAPRFAAADPRWLSELQPAQSLPGTVALVGSAAAAPTITLAGGASGGTVTNITLSNESYADVYYQLLLDLSIGASQTAIIDVARRTMRQFPGGASVLGTLQPGSRLSSFFLYPGNNDLTIDKTGTVAASLQYVSRYWSWEDADV
jgi:hypothetical protein